MHSAIVLVAFVCYSILVFVLKRITYPKNKEPAPPFPHGWDKGHEYTLMLSQDFWWAARFKSRIKQFRPRDVRTSALKSYVKVNNYLNFWVSVSLTTALFCSAAASRGSPLFKLLLAVAVIRFISRSFEISYAFGRDVLQSSTSTTGLNKFERIQLALVSYIEIFVYSSAAYLVLPTIKGPLEAITLSLNVGTLTNVGLAFPDKHAFYNNIVFIQVFATLSLVVLSLASYLSRER